MQTIGMGTRIPITGRPVPSRFLYSTPIATIPTQFLPELPDGGILSNVHTFDTSHLCKGSQILSVDTVRVGRMVPTSCENPRLTCRDKIGKRFPQYSRYR